MDEWRKYEPFPSAYPPTPLTHTTFLPSERVASGGTLDGIGEEPGVVDEWRMYEPFPAAYPPTPLPSTSRLPNVGRPLSAAPLGGIAEGTNGDDHSNDTREEHLADEDEDPEDEEDEMIGVHEGVLSEQDMEVDEEDDYEEEEEDDFNITLQTPQPISRYQNFSAASSADPNDDSTGLSTVDLGSPLRTRTNSEASTLAGSESTSSSVVGKKRTLAVSSGGESVENGVRRPGVGVRTTAAPKFAIKPKTAPTRTQLRPVRARRPPASVEPSSAGATTDDKESMEGSDASSMTSKKRRVGGGTMRPPGAVKPRPGLPSRSESDKTTSSEGAPRKPRVNPIHTTAPSSSRPVRKVTDPSTDSDRTLGRTSRSSTLVAQTDDGSSTIGRSRARVGNRT